VKNRRNILYLVLTNGREANGVSEKEAIHFKEGGGHAHFLTTKYNLTLVHRERRRRGKISRKRGRRKERRISEADFDTYGERRDLYILSGRRAKKNSSRTWPGKGR